MERTSFEDLANLIENNYEVNGRKSLGSLLDRIQALRLTFGKTRPIDVSHADLSKYVDGRLKSGAKAATIRYELTVFGRMFRLAIQAGILKVQPLLPTIKVENARKGFFEVDQINGVLKHLPADIAPAIAFAYYTGWRIGEIRQLTWGHLAAKTKTIRLEGTETKTGKGRLFPFQTHPELVRLLADQKNRVMTLQREQQRVIPWMFPRSDGTQLGQFHKQWTKACKDAGCPGKLVHDLRRTAVRNLVRAGVTENVAMALSGHRTRCIFDRYNIVSESDLAGAVSKLSHGPTGS